MATYVRPTLDYGQWLDKQGEPIPYGQVYWSVGREPAESTYGECAHPERFAPVVQVAKALITYLESSFEVGRADVDGVTTLTPAVGAPLSFGWLTGEIPGVETTAGWGFGELWPDCGCDACDDAVPEVGGYVEATVLTVVEGGFSQWRTRRKGFFNRSEPPWHAHARFEGRRTGEESSWNRAEAEPLHLPTQPFRWPPWPTR
mgnify:FL=1